MREAEGHAADLLVEAEALIVAAAQAVGQAMEALVAAVLAERRVEEEAVTRVTGLFPMPRVSDLINECRKIRWCGGCMGGRTRRAILFWLFPLVLFPGACITPGVTQASAAGRSSSTQQSPRTGKNGDGIYSVPQYRPCPDQTKSFEDLSRSFASGHLPSRSEITGSWVLTGIWLYPDSHPDLNCNGITRGKALEWVMLADGYSLRVDMAGTYLQSDLATESGGSLEFSVDLGGDDSPVFKCRLTQRHTLACMGTPYYSGAEFKPMRVNCPALADKTAAQGEPRLCTPYKQR